jgi:hypothetical protein
MSFTLQEEATSTVNSVSQRSQVAIILPNLSSRNGEFVPELARVGTLPVLLRAILGAKSAHAERILVVLDSSRAREIQCELEKTGRVPESVEWMVVEEGGALPAVLRIAAEEADNIVLMMGDRIYHPALHRTMREWHGENCALAFTSGLDPVGMIVLSKGLALHLAQNYPTSIASFDDVYQWVALTQERLAESGSCLESVPADMWQRIDTPEDCAAAERRLA